MNKQKVNSVLFAAVLLLAASWKICLLIMDVFPFNSDEAIVGLMAKHILAGERPIFFYGQVYMGSLDAWLVAAGFAVFGSHIWVIRLIQIFLYIITIAITMSVVNNISGNPWAGLITGLLLAIPPVNTTLYTTISLGGYGEALLIGSLLLLVYTKYLKKEKSKFAGWTYVSCAGFLTGIGFWVNAITLVFSIPVFCLLIYGWIKKPLNRVDSGKPIIHLGLYFLGVIIGLVPWFSSILQTNLQTVIAENIGSAVAVGNDNYFTSIILHLRNYLLFGITAVFGIRPPWGVQILGKPLFVLAIMTWVGIFIFGVKKAKAAIQGEFFYLLLGIVVVFTAGFLFSPFGNDPSGRYFLPLYLVFAILASLDLRSLFRKQIFTVLPVLVLLGFHLWGTMQCANENPPGLTTQFDSVTQINHAYDEQLIKFLQSQNELAGFTNYWVAYPLSFKSDEDLIYIPALPYHQDLRFTERDNRYIPYKQTVLASPKVAYITTNNPVLNDRIRSGFRDIEITWLEKQIGDYHVFYRLSKLVYPQDMELGLME